MKVIAIQKQDEPLIIRYIAKKDAANPYITEEELFNKALNEAKQLGTCEVIELNDLPQDRKFRSAWRLENKKCEENKVIAREIIRSQRDKKLQELDLLAFSESRKPQGKLEILNTKAQLLRDIPQRAGFNEMNISELKSVLTEIEQIIEGEITC